MDTPQHAERRRARRSRALDFSKRMLGSIAEVGIRVLPGVVALVAIRW